ncbi:MAG: zinc ribbon domain-containing protein [Parasporobacterium sp.]|nr:zinc ribbon domain-containing protein [Parasporobacterium sp.]
MSDTILGTRNLVEGLRELESGASEEPKSLNAMTSLYLPQIKKDFPEFSYDEMKNRANNVLTSYLFALDSMSASGLSEGSPELKSSLENRIASLKSEGVRENYKSVHIHRTEISNYRKSEGRCIITFQMSCQYYFSRINEYGEITEGSTDRLRQTRYSVDVIYIQDRDRIANEHDYALGSNCPNCGAPLKGLGAKVCEYCGTPLREINIYAWAFSDVREQ